MRWDGRGPGASAIFSTRLIFPTHRRDRAALDFARTGGYDCLVLDIMTPKMSGLEVVSELRREGSGVPVPLLTAKGEASDRVLGLDSGADDYLPKPFHMSEFLARVRARASEA